MKQAFAKLMEKDPVQSSHTAFRAGGNNVPILTRASGQSTAGVQTMGLPTGSKPYPGGGANRTVLGAIRMGDQDGNAPGSAIISSDIFYPPGQPDREYPERTFANVGNNVYQPENNDAALHALLTRLGDQQFKAKAMMPFEDYRVQQAQAAAIAEASRNASLSDVGTGREILRSMVAERRAQTESEFVRKILAGGGSMESAQKELQAVKDANALHEARTVEGREYQAKTLIQRMAAARGVTPMARESLIQSSAISNPQPSQAMSQAMGMPGEGAGTSPLDQQRVSIDPDFYDRARTLRADAAEARERQQAFATLATQGRIPEPDQGSFSLATLDGQDKQQKLDATSEALAARLESIRSRSTRILLPLPTNVIAKDLLDRIYANKGKRVADTVLFSSETIQDMRPLQLLIALNMAISLDRGAYSRITRALAGRNLGTPERPSPTVMNTLKEVAQIANNGEPNISIPFVSTNVPISNSQLVSILQDIRTSGSIRSEAAAAVKKYDAEGGEPAISVASAAVPVPGSGPTRGRSRRVRSLEDTRQSMANRRMGATREGAVDPGFARMISQADAISRLNTIRQQRSLPPI